MHRALPLFAALSAVLLLPAGAAAGPAASGDGAAEVAVRPWTAGTEFEVLAVVHTAVPAVPDPATMPGCASSSSPLPCLRRPRRAFAGQRRSRVR